MESLPFHGENRLEENTADQREEIDDNEKKKKEICNYKPVIANDSVRLIRNLVQSHLVSGLSAFALFDTQCCWACTRSLISVV